MYCIYYGPLCAVLSLKKTPLFLSTMQALLFYTHARKFAKTDWLCLCQEASESESHLLSGKCRVHGDLIENFGDLKEDNNLVSFFRAVLDRRDTTEEEDLIVQDTLGACSVLGLPGIQTRRLEDLCS